MLGRDMLGALAAHDARGLGREDLDITNGAAVAQACTGVDVVVNCAAWTRVDDAESREADAFVVNALGAANLAGACVREGAQLVQISTDYVFDGHARTPYAEDSPLAPQSAYGRTKAAGEWAVRAALPQSSYVVRTAWLYGAGGPNFVRTMATLATKHDYVEVVADQRGQPTWSRDVAFQVVALIDSGASPGVYHATSEGSTTWWGFARAVFELLGQDPAAVRRASSQRAGRRAARPAWSVLGHDKWAESGLPSIGAWQDRLQAAWPSLVSSF